MVTRRQHYIWRHYLSPWLVEDKVQCLRNKKVFGTSPMNIGQERDFYRLQDLTKEEIELIYELSVKKNHDSLKEVNSGWLNVFTMVHKFKSVLEGTDAYTDEMKQKFLDEEIELEEKLQGEIEHSGIHLLKSSLDADLSFFDDEQGRIDFFYYICTQYLRTKAMKNAVLTPFTEFKGVKIERIWNVLKHTYGCSLVWGLIAANPKFSLYVLENNTSVNFITGDQPVVNIHATKLNREKEVSRLEFYYPISPTKALLMSQQELPSKEIVLTEQEVVNFNEHIYMQSDSQIYATEPSDFEFFTSDVVPYYDFSSCRFELTK